jgi:hypothetical protein
MAMENYSRPKDGFRFNYGGLKLNAAPNSLQPTKYPSAVNIRGYNEDSVGARPGQVLRFTAGGAGPVTDLASYTALNTDNKPRYLARAASDIVYLDTGLPVGTLAGGGLSAGATFIPFRPAQSPTPYLYVANGYDYQKFSAPDVTNTVVARKVGIAEPQTAPLVAPLPQMFTELLAPGGVWTPGGDASGWSSGNRTTDVVIGSLSDPNSAVRYSIQVSHTTAYQIGEIVNFLTIPSSPGGASTNVPAIVEDVIAPLSLPLTIAAIEYPFAANGNCVIVLQGLSAKSDDVDGPTTEDVIAQFRRGALIRIGGTETCYVWSVTTGPNNQVCIETSTGLVHAIGESVTGLPTIIVNGITNPAAVVVGTPLIGDAGNTQSFAVAEGVGTLTMGASGGINSVIFAVPIVQLNGWGPNAHVGNYEGGVNQGYAFGLNGGTTQPYTNPNYAIDDNLTTFAYSSMQGTHNYAGCVWAFPAGPPSTIALSLNINSEVPPNGTDGQTVTLRSASLFYSLDGGTTWSQIYDSANRPQQWDSVPLSPTQDLSKVQVMAFSDAHDDMYHKVFEINITQAAISPSIGGSTGAYDDQDYLHLSILTDNPTAFEEMRLQFDVGDGSFSQNYFYVSVSPNQLIPATADVATTLATIQATLQQDAVTDAAQQSGLTAPMPSVPGANQWTEIWIPIGGLTRVGGDLSKSLANITNIQVLVNATATINVKVSSIAFVGGGSPDIGDLGQPYLYRVRPRDSRTGALGNPSPATRYGSPAHRQPLTVVPPSATYDPQIDTWDVFRFGGSSPRWSYIGSMPITQTAFNDNYDDSAALAGNALDFDNFEPWPSIDLPLTNIVATKVAGFTAIVNIPGTTNVLRFLPGTLVQLGGQNAYTLYQRPVPIGGGLYLFFFVENAGSGTNVTVTIQEPALARQFLPYMFGPDSSGHGLRRRGSSARRYSLLRQELRARQRPG